MDLSNPAAFIYVPSGAETGAALAQTTHLGIVAHPDDLEIAAFDGILRAREQAEGSFSGVVATHGGASPRTGELASASDDAMQALRRDEQLQAARIGGYGAVALLDHDSTSVKGDAAPLVGDLQQILRVAQPRCIYTHNLCDRHDTHVAVALAVVTALRRLDMRPERLLGCEVWRDLDWLTGAARVPLDVSGHDELARELIGCFASQIGGKRYDRAVLGRRHAQATLAEPHTVDRAQAVILAMDMNELLDDPTLSAADFVARQIDGFRLDATERLGRLEKGTPP